MFNEGYSLSDIAAVSGSNDGFGNGGWGMWIWVILILAIFGWGNGGWGGYGNIGGQGASNNYILASDFATIQRQLSDGFSGIEKGIDVVRNGLCDGFYTEAQLINGVNMNIMQGNNAIQTQLADCCCKTQQNIKDTQYAIATTGAGIQNAIKDCCCENEKIAMQNRYESAQQNCATLQAISDSTKQIIDYMAAEKAQNLRDENFTLKLAASQANQNNFIQNLIKPPINPCYVTQNPYCSCGNVGFYGCGYGTTIA